MDFANSGKIEPGFHVQLVRVAPRGSGPKEDVMEDRERRVPDTEEEADVEAHRTVPGPDEAEDARREGEDDPDVEGHRLVPRTEIGRTEIGRSEL